jgi:tRNA pseudouridine55 synthase
VIINNTFISLQNIDFSKGHILLISKEKGWTSFDVVNKIRYMIRKKLQIKKIKVGHGGTLDPLATGVLVIGIGSETKNLIEYQNQTKEYVAEVTFGSVTASYDAETEPFGTFETSHISQKSIEDCLHKHFSGTIHQTPPIYSAKTIDGVRAYKSAREGKHVEMKSVPVTIYEHEVLSFADNKARIRIACSKGTYIRSIAHDLGKQLKSGAYLTELKRTKSGSFSATDCLQIKQFESLLTTI